MARRAERRTTPTTRSPVERPEPAGALSTRPSDSCPRTTLLTEIVTNNAAAGTDVEIATGLYGTAPPGSQHLDVGGCHLTTGGSDHFIDLRLKLRRGRRSSIATPVATAPFKT